MAERRVLLISDQFAPSEHSAVEGIFGAGLPGVAETAVVEFSRESRVLEVAGGRAVLPSACRRRGLLRAIAAAWPERHWDWVIVRNGFPALAQVLSERKRHRAQIGFWLSFPHTYRRLHEAIVERRSVWRKRLEFWLRDWREQRLLSRCDCFLPITAALVREFYSNLTVPWQALPMGIDLAGLGGGRRVPREPGPLRLAYTGTVDPLRRLDVIVQAVQRATVPVALDIYSASDNPAVTALRTLRDPRIRLLPGRSRAELFAALANADVGVGLIPDTRLYRVGSPTKAIEYAALGLVPLLNPLPDYLELFDERSAAFCAFEPGAIRDAVIRLATQPAAERDALAARARTVVQARRDYRQLAAQLVNFLARVRPA